MMTPYTIDKTLLAEFLDMVSGGDKEVAAEFIDMYIEDGTSLLTSIWQAFKQNDVREFTRHVHTLKSSSAQIGATNLSQKSRVLEEIGRSGTLDINEELIKDVDAEFAKVKEILIQDHL